MKAHFPYVYLVEHVPKRRKRAVLGYGADTVEVEVPEISLSETKLVASLEVVLRRPDETIVIPDQYRAWKGDLLSPVKDEDFEKFPIDWLLSSPGDRSVAPYAFKLLYGFLPFEEKSRRIEHFASGRLASSADFFEFEELGPRVVRSEREDDLAIVGKLAGDLVSVEGALWRKSRNVGFYLDTRPSGESWYMAFRGGAFGYLPRARDSEEERGRYPGWVRSYSHSQLERVIAHAGEVNLEMGFQSLEVFDSEALFFDGEKNFILNAMDYAVIRNADLVGEMPIEAAVAWSTVRGAVARVRADRTSDFSDDELEAFRTLAEGSASEQADFVRKACHVCDEYLNDPWGRYGPRLPNIAKHIRRP